MKAVLVACLVAGFAVFTGCRPRNLAPDFTLPLLASPGQSVTLSELNRNHPVLVIFWATWCPTCREELPALNKWQELYYAKGLRILAVNVRESRERISAYLQEYPVHYPVLLDETGDVATRFQLSGLPATVFVAKGGEIRYYGFSLPSGMESWLRS